MKTEFKVGDEVRCINDIHVKTYLTTGNKYVVEGVSKYEHSNAYLLNLRGVYFHFSAERFERVGEYTVEYWEKKLKEVKTELDNCKQQLARVKEEEQVVFEENVLEILRATSFKGSYFKNKSGSPLRWLFLSKDTNPIIYSRKVESSIMVGNPSANCIIELCKKVMELRS